MPGRKHISSEFPLCMYGSTIPWVSQKHVTGCRAPLRTSIPSTDGVPPTPLLADPMDVDEDEYGEDGDQHTEDGSDNFIEEDVGEP